MNLKFSKLKKKVARPIVCRSRTMDQKFVINSSSRPDVKYTIKFQAVEGEKGNWTCSCPAFIYRKPMVLTCKHIEDKKSRVCTWKSSVGPEFQTEDGKCPRCGYMTQEEGAKP